MLAEQRRDRILEILSQQGSVSVNDLHEALGVSRETVRRDLTRLAQENRLRKTHGGALTLDGGEPVFDERMVVNPEGKRAIGRRAAELVEDGMSLTVDSGTTTIWLAEALMERRRLTVYTNDVHVAQRLAGRNDNRVLLAGGEYLASEGATVGRDTIAMLANYHPDIAFVGASALSDDPWLMDYSREAAEMRGSMLALAHTPVLLADHSKFGRTAPVRIAELEKVKRIIVDQRPGERLAQGLRATGIEVIVAPAG